MLEEKEKYVFYLRQICDTTVMLRDLRELREYEQKLEQFKELQNSSILSKKKDNSQSDIQVPSDIFQRNIAEKKTGPKKNQWHSFTEEQKNAAVCFWKKSSSGNIIFYDANEEFYNMFETDKEQLNEKFSIDYLKGIIKIPDFFKTPNFVTQNPLAGTVKASIGEISACVTVTPVSEEIFMLNIAKCTKETSQFLTNTTVSDLDLNFHDSFVEIFESQTISTDTDIQIDQIPSQMTTSSNLDEIFKITSNAIKESELSNFFQ